MEESIIYMLINLVLWIYFLNSYYEERNVFFSMFQFMISLPLIIEVSAISFYNSTPMGYLISFAIALCSFFTLGFSYYEKNKKKK